MRSYWLVVLLTLLSFSVKAQTSPNPVLTWDHEVGCIKYSDEESEKQKHLTFIEKVQAGVCLRVCENTQIKYSLRDEEIVLVEWDVVGGEVNDKSNSGAVITWGNAGNGMLIISITYKDGTVEVLKICVEKIARPGAKFQAFGTIENTLCRATPVTFTNDSDNNGGSDIVQYHWDFGDGTTSSEFEPTHTYENSGTYTVRLTVTNSCNCTDTYEVKYRVLDNKPFEISCPSVVCENSQVTYSVNDGCGGKWNVIGGTIVSDQGTSVDIVWDNVDPRDGFGYIFYRSSCNCEVPAVVKVPVILSRAKIQGPTHLCEGEQARFKLPQWPTTDFVWAINDDPNHPLLTRSDQRNEIIVNGTIPGSYTLSVKYHNTLINEGKCEGEAKFKFVVEKRPKIATDDNLIHCERADMSFYTLDGTDVAWKITNYNNVIHTSYGSTMSYYFDRPGTYLIQTDNERCNSAPITVQILDKPYINSGIQGDRLICLNTPYTYRVNESDPNASYLWTVTNGTIVGDNTQSEITVQFTGSPATVQVIKNRTYGNITCTSDPVSLQVNKYELNPVIVNNSGLDEFCSSSTATFTVDLGNITPDLIEWSLTSDATSGNFGGIINGGNAATVTVAFNEINTSPTGTLKVKVVKCGIAVERTFQIRLLQNPVITIGAIGNVCPSQSYITIPFSITPATLPSTQIKVFIDNVLHGTYTYTNNLNSLQIPNPFVNNSSTNASKVLKLEVVTCNRTSFATKIVNVFPNTQISISPSTSYVVCPTNYPPIQLTSTLSTGATSSVQFKWYKNGSSTVLSTQPNLTISGPNPGGTYYLEVKDINSCVVRSELVHVNAYCPSPDPSNPIVCEQTASVTATWSSCGQITAVLQSNPTPTSITWMGSEHLSLVQSTQNTTTAKFNTTVPGTHVVTARINYGACILYRTFSISKQYEPRLLTSIACNGNGTYNVTLLNNSLIANVNESTLTFKYSGPNVPLNATGNSYTINNVAPGTYTYTLSVSAPGKPTCTTTVSVNLPALPNAFFGLPNQFTPYCSNEVIPLSITNYDASNRYEWKFTKGTSITTYIASGATTMIQLSEPGAYRISLKITTPLGCTVETHILNRPTITITKADFQGGFYNLRGNTFCEGSAVPITVGLMGQINVPTLSTLQNAIWMNGNQQVGTGTSYTPTQSGSYWPILIDQNGCKSYVMATNPFNYILKKPPVAKISGSLSVCGGTVSLTGETTNTTVEHRWIGNEVPVAYTNWVSGNTNKVLTISNLAPGTYTFTFQTRLPNDPNCIGSKTVSVVVKPAAQMPTVSYNVILCSPYTIRLTASGPNEGTYNWSNGMTGKEITVPHGGAYSVTYTAPTGCSATAYIQTPHDIDRTLLWSIPSGCYTVCEPAYILGPLGPFPYYKWEINDGVVQEGSPIIPEQHIIRDGTYQLIIEQEGCTYESNAPVISRDYKKCPPKSCEIKADFEILKWSSTYVYFYLHAYNPYNYPITVSLSSLMGYGTFNPTSITLSPGSSTIGIEFFANNSFTDGSYDTFILTGPDCVQMVEVYLKDPYATNSARANAITSVTLSPNPASEQTTVSYQLGEEFTEAQRITVYDLLGIQRYQQAVSGTEGEINLAVGHLTNGTYLIVLEADGRRVATVTLIKN
ncbi:PKD domain-containing protein [Myroides sp. WP-1]|uniref:PKD domain-containing protein n=1 Tax=Myroides sp. WP-1 TaxID=2759944 RepID=UPI00272954CA|nr:PKD domain-containing protein [Myroides sp. WP-1]